MKRLITLLCLLLVISGCSTVGGAVAVVNPLNFTNTAFYPLLIIGELETNFSSLVIDKTKAHVEDFSVNPFEVLPEKSLIYVMPAIMTRSYQKSYDTFYSNLVKRYIQINNFAVVTEDIEKADFVLMTTVAESPERRRGKPSLEALQHCPESRECSIEWKETFSGSELFGKRFCLLSYFAGWTCTYS